MEESNNAQEFSMLEIIEFDWRECIFVIVNKDCAEVHTRRGAERAGVAQLQLHSLARAATTSGD